jgi:sugar O-acyltransferase (sialic acid O-acetyltransferase NeuD family)
MQRLIILGTRAYAEEVADLAADTGQFELVGFGENWERERAGGDLLGRPIVWVDDLAAMARDTQAVCAIGTTQRWQFVEAVRAMGFEFARLRHPSARLSETSTIGPGSILSTGVIVAAHTRLGAHVIVNRGSLIGHHTEIADYVTVSPGANIAGRVHIGTKSYIGMGAIVLDGITIGERALVGAGALVTKDVPDRVQVMGVPARITRENVDGR